MGFRGWWDWGLGVMGIGGVRGWGVVPDGGSWWLEIGGLGFGGWRGVAIGCKIRRKELEGEGEKEERSPRSKTLKRRRSQAF